MYTLSSVTCVTVGYHTLIMTECYYQEKRQGEDKEESEKQRIEIKEKYRKNEWIKKKGSFVLDY